MDWLLDLGYGGVLVGSFLAGTIFTFSSEILLVGILVAGGDPWICLALATIGNGTGAITSYVLGWLGKWEWIERWFKVQPETLARQKARVDRYGVWGALLSWAPFVGQVFMVALGFYRVKPRTTVLLTYLGCFARFLVLTLLYIHYGEAFTGWLTR
ncbi:MAG: DedA family protein [Rikenellaceae bacterium]|jgi:membrane protein YqaA with SNARE-associated domain|nr:DedA family protein [Rikenellaceae bacterium]